MSLVLVLLLPLAGGVLAALTQSVTPRVRDLVAALGLVAAMVVLLFGGGAEPTPEVNVDWIPWLGARFHLRMDGLSHVMVWLTLGLGLVAVLVWRGAREQRGRNPGLFHLATCATLTGILGVFLAADLLVFFLAWELMLVPMFLIIALWGHEFRRRAAFVFLLFSQLGGLALLAGIAALAWFHHAQTGVMSMDIEVLVAANVGASVSAGVELAVLACFLVAFGVKLPLVPLHVWLPEAHTEAPTAGSVLLAGLLLKTGAYGLIRLAMPLFPRAAALVAPVAVALGAVGVVYGAMLAFGQTDLKRLVAFTSVSHMGFVVVGVFSWTELSVQGAIMQMVCHGLSAAGLFIVVGIVSERAGSRQRSAIGGLADRAPALGVLAGLLALASLGLPTMGTFIGELAILAGTWPKFPGMVVVSSLGLVLSAVYALSWCQGIFWGPPDDGPSEGLRRPVDLAVLGALVAGLLTLGVMPWTLFDATRGVVADSVADHRRTK